MPAVAFDYAAWVARYPEFATVTEPTADMYFTEATLYLDNTAGSQVQDLAKRTLFLNMLTAHVAAIYSGANGVSPSPLVGRISAATEGSVNVTVELTLPEQAAFFSQTKYGLSYWQATAYLRTMRYVAPRCAPYGYGGLFRGPGFW